MVPIVIANTYSTGGIIALGFGVKNWHLRTCSRKFEELCHGAFSPRKLHNIPIMRHLITLKHAAKYETTPLRTILEHNFGKSPLVGSDDTESSLPRAKVAVTATNETGKRAVLIANYLRKKDTFEKHRKSHHEFFRPRNPSLELATWEAAAATSAAPSYFKPFIHARTSRTFLDGAIYHNNPVWIVHRERKLLWPDVADKPPDIFLSIGTGQGSDLDQKPPGNSATRRSMRK